MPSRRRLWCRLVHLPWRRDRMKTGVAQSRAAWCSAERMPRRLAKPEPERESVCLLLSFLLSSPIPSFLKLQVGESEVEPPGSLPQTGVLRIQILGNSRKPLLARPANVHVLVQNSAQPVREEHLHLPGRHTLDVFVLCQGVLHLGLATLLLFLVVSLEESALSNAHAAPHLANL